MTCMYGGGDVCLGRVPLVCFFCRWSPRSEQPRPQAAPERLGDELSSGSLLSCSLVLDLENRSRLRTHDIDVLELWIELVRGGTRKGSSSSMITLQLSKSRGRWWSRRGSSGYLCVSLSPAETLYKQYYASSMALYGIDLNVHESLSSPGVTAQGRNTRLDDGTMIFFSHSASTATD